MPTADYRSSWINEQCCGSAKTSEFVSWHSELVFEVLYCSQLVSVFLSISQVLYYAEKSIFPSTHLGSCIYKALWGWMQFLRCLLCFADFYQLHLCALLQPSLGGLGHSGLLHAQQPKQPVSPTSQLHK